MVILYLIGSFIALGGGIMLIVKFIRKKMRERELKKLMHSYPYVSSLGYYEVMLALKNNKKTKK